MTKANVLTIFLAAGLALSAPLAAQAKNPHSGGGSGSGGGGGNSMKGGLPGLTSRVAADEALIATLQTQVSSLSGQSNFAVVAADGTLARSNSDAGPVSVVTHTAGTGLYEVDFSTDVSGCAYVATLGDTASGAPPLGVVGISGASNTDGVTIQTADLAGAPTDEPFHLSVSCP